MKPEGKYEDILHMWIYCAWLSGCSNWHASIICQNTELVCAKLDSGFISEEHGHYFQSSLSEQLRGKITIGDPCIVSPSELLNIICIS